MPFFLPILGRIPMMNFKRSILLPILLCIIAAGVAFASGPVTHTMQKGETLYSIAKKYNIPYESLAAANGISDPTKLKIGTVLIIPSVHLVSKGETLYGIARLYSISLDELLTANKLTASYVLKPGDILVIPGGKPDSGTAVTTVAAPPATVPQSETTVSTAASATTTTLAKSVPPAAAPSSTTTTLAKTTPATAAPPSTAATTAKPSPALSSTTSSNGTAATVPATSTTVTAPVPMPEPVKTQDKVVDPKAGWPAPGKVMYLDGKLEGVMIRVKPGEIAKAIASGTVVSAGPSRGFNQVVFVQAKSGYVYVYGGNETLLVKTGDTVKAGSELGKIGIDSKDNSPIAYFFVFRNGQPIDPALAPRE